MKNLRSKHVCFGYDDSNHRGSVTRSIRAAFSLFELVIVVAIIAVVAAMAAPQIMSMMRESTVFEAADSLRDAMGETRRFAINTGIDYEFRYEVNGPTVVVLPAELERDVDEQGTSQTTEAYVRIVVELPETIRLRAAEGVTESAERLEAEAFGSLGSEDGATIGATQLAQKTWSAPIMFRFDGTADDFDIRVSDEGGLTSTVTLRGLTGSVRTSQVFQEED